MFYLLKKVLIILFSLMKQVMIILLSLIKWVLIILFSLIKQVLIILFSLTKQVLIPCENGLNLWGWPSTSTRSPTTVFPRSVKSLTSPILHCRMWDDLVIACQTSFITYGHISLSLCCCVIMLSLWLKCSVGGAPHDCLLFFIFLKHNSICFINFIIFL